MSTAAKNLFQQLSISCKNCSLGELCIPHELNQSDIDKLDDSVSHTKLLQPEEVLYSQGEKFSSLFAVKSGSVKITNLQSGGEESVIGIYLPGEIVGFDGLSSEHYQCTISALETTSICEIHLDKLEETIPEIYKNLLKHACTRVNEANNVYTANKQTAEKRIVSFLLDLSRRYQQRGYVHTYFNLLLSRSELGNVLDLTPESVSRGLRKLEREGYISIQLQKQITINNLEGLKTLVQEKTS